MKPFPIGVYLSQHKYTQDILHKTKMLESAPLATPMAVKDISSNPEPVDATNLYALSDTDWASFTTTRKSITSFCTFLGTNFIS